MSEAQPEHLDPPLAAEAPSRILVPTDLSPHAHRALVYAADIARPTGAEIHLLHVHTVYDSDPEIDEIVVDHERAAAERREEALAEAADAQKQSGLQVQWSTVRSHSVYDAVLTYAREHEVDLIVLGTHGYSGLKYVLLGSVAQQVVQHARVPVLVVRQTGRQFASEDAPQRIKRVLFPTDYSERSRAAAPVALSLAQTQDAELIVANVVRVVEPGTAENPSRSLDHELWARLGQEAEALFGQYAKLHLALWEGPVVRSLTRVCESEEVDLVVMASAGRSGLKDHLLGSDAERMARLAPCPVLIIK